MGIDPNSLPDRIKDKIADPKEKKRVGKTWAEKVAEKDDQSESELRERIISFCWRHKLVPVSPAPTKKSTIKKGAADLTILGRRLGLCIELKVGTNKLSPDQEQFCRLIEEASSDYYVIRDYKTGIDLITKYFHLIIVSPDNE